MQCNMDYLADGRAVYSCNISDGMGSNATILTYGAVVQSLEIFTEAGTRQVVLGYDSAQQYLEKPYYMGCVVGRVAGRIADAKLKLEGKVYPLSDNSNGVHLHGGADGFNTKCFDIVKQTSSSVALEYLSPAGESGYPGDLSFRVEYRLENCSLIVKYSAVSTNSTVISPTQHSYFLLGGRDIQEHLLKINSDSIYELDDRYLRTGKILSVQNTPFDFRKGKSVGEALASQHPQLDLTGGLDHSFVLPSSKGELYRAATLSYGELAMDCITNMSVLHLYSSNFLDTHRGRGGAVYSKYSGLCLECQDTAHTLNSKEQYNREVIYRFYKL